MRPRARQPLRVAEEEVSVTRKLMENAFNPYIIFATRVFSAARLSEDVNTQLCPIACLRAIDALLPHQP